MDYKVVINGRFPGMNEWIAATNRNRHVGNSMKQQWQATAQWAIKLQIPWGTKIKTPVRLIYDFYEQNKRRDHDNVSGFAHKVIQDAMVAQGILPDDGWDEITGYTDTFYLDRKNPRIEITIREEDSNDE